MKFMNSFDVAEMVIEEATKQFSPLWSLNAENFDIFKQYCFAIDYFIEEIESNGIEISVDEIRMTVSVVVFCKNATLLKNSKFFLLAERTSHVSVSLDENNDLKFEFVFPSLWDRKVYESEE